MSADRPLFETLEPLDRETVEQYQNVIGAVRRIHLGVLGKNGRRLKGPQFLAVTRCSECLGVGMTSSKHPAKKRWTCDQCGAIRYPIWSDGPTPDDEEVSEHWFANAPATRRPTPVEAKSAKGHRNFVKRHGCSIKRQGTRCPQCDGSPPIPG
jgi:hypothetical protein